METTAQVRFLKRKRGFQNPQKDFLMGSREGLLHSIVRVEGGKASVFVTSGRELAKRGDIHQPGKKTRERGQRREGKILNNAAKLEQLILHFLWQSRSEF